MATLEGVSDLHVHAGPDIRVRSATDIEVVQAADSAGMHAVLLKTHWTCTADRDVAAALAVGPKKVRVYGGLTLDYSVGGLNIHAVEKALTMGAKEVWLPTHDARSHRRYYRTSGGITITQRDNPDALRRDVTEIVDLVGLAGAIIGTGHISAPEIFALLRYCRPKRYKVLVTHPEWHSTRHPIPVQREMASLGASFERCVASTFIFPDNRDPVAPSETAHIIREVGVRSSIVASDLGQSENPRPAEGLLAFLTALESAGLRRDEVRAVSAFNPAELLEHDRREI